MSEENYRLFNADEIAPFSEKLWFDDEAIMIYRGSQRCYLIPEKRVLKEVNRKQYFRDKLQELLDDYDFDKVERVMAELQWTWAGVNGYPTEDDMIPLVKNLYDSIENRVIENRYAYCATGGFKLTYNPDEDEELSLVFEAVTGSVYGD